MVERDFLAGILVCLAMVLLVPGLLLPVLEVAQFLVFRSEFSLLDTVASLFSSGEIVPGLIVLVFSVILPVVKILLTFWMWLHTDRRNVRIERFSRLLRWTSIVGKWSMLDVYLVALVVASLSLELWASISVGIGAYFFCASIIAGMAATIRLGNLANSGSSRR